jgi:hypothetical protein
VKQSLRNRARSTSSRRTSRHCSVRSLARGPDRARARRPLDELRQSIAKARDLTASRGSAVEERLIAELGWVTEASARGERRLNAILVLVGLTALLALFRC